MFIQRDWERTEEDDFALNVRLGKLEEAVPVYHEGKVVGWKIQQQYE